MDILQLEDLGDTSVISECSLGVNLVIDNFFYVASDSSPRCIKFESNRNITYRWRYCILKIWGIRVSFGCERSCSSHRRVSNFELRVFTSSGSTGGRDAKTISPNTSFGDIIT